MDTNMLWFFISTHYIEENELTCGNQCSFRPAIAAYPGKEVVLLFPLHRLHQERHLLVGREHDHS